MSLFCAVITRRESAILSLLTNNQTGVEGNPRQTNDPALTSHSRKKESPNRSIPLKFRSGKLRPPTPARFPIARSFRTTAFPVPGPVILEL
jgi:hypothetical protein